MTKTKLNLSQINKNLEYRNGTLHLEGVNLKTLAEKETTTLYAYSKAAITSNFNEYASDKVEVCYSVKANSNLHILKHLASMGSGVDIVSGGELFRALQAGIDPKKIVYSGVCKTEKELEYAITSDILMLNTESESEVETINKVAGNLGKKAGISIRINPGVDPKTHPYISTGFKKNKFGISEEGAARIIKNLENLPNVELLGLDCHIGSQLTSLEPFSEAMDKILGFMDRHSVEVKYIDLGGGLGINYGDDSPPKIKEYVALIEEKFKGTNVKIIVEPGRSIVGDAGLLIGKVHYVKDNGTRKFYLSDVGMNELMRPSLYKAKHLVVSVCESTDTEVVDLVGPICESSDVVLEQEELSKMSEGDLFVVLSAGAYGFSMASNYNSHPRPAEILVDGDSYTTIRKRETYEDLIKGEL
jgi:diaminopimelate decarboxylase